MSLSFPSLRSERETGGHSSGGAEPETAQVRSFTKDLRRHPSYRRDIDGLRALAIIPVVVFHAFPRLLPGGFIGVDIFFVISGFLISGIIFKGLQRESFSFPGFYANRIKRIFPALLLVLTASVAFGWFFLLPGEYRLLGKHIVGGVGFGENFVLWREAGYFDTRSYLKPLMHLWSLGIEEQFYLTYPLLLWLIWRLRRNVLAILVPLTMISFGLNLWMVRSHAVATFFMPQTRVWELWVGGILAYLEISRAGSISAGNWVVRAFRLSDGSEATDLEETRSGTLYLSAPLLNNIYSVAGIVSIAAALLLVHESAFPGWWAVLPVGGAALLICGGPRAWINRRVLSWRVAVVVGLISYPLYLWHWPILSFARILHGYDLPVSFTIGAVAFSIFLAWMTWRFVESPIRFGRRVWTKTAALTLLSLVLGAIGFTILKQEGFAGRVKNLSEDFGLADATPHSTADCRKTLGSDKMGYCRSLLPRMPDVLLIGDSHAASLYEALATSYGQRSQNLMNLGADGCLPFYDTETYTRGLRERDCRPLVNRMLEFATSTATVRTIILSARGPMNMTGAEFGEDAQDRPPEEIAWAGAPNNSTRAEIFAGAFRETVRRLSAAGKNVVLLIDWPELGFDPRNCLPRPVAWFSSVRPLCGVPRSRVEARNQTYRDIIFEIKKDFSDVKTFDTFPFLCDSAVCYGMNDGHLLYRDGNHLSAVGAAYVSGKFVAEQFPHKR